MQQAALVLVLESGSAVALFMADTVPRVALHDEKLWRRKSTMTGRCRGVQAERAYYRLRLERVNKRHLGKRTKRAAEAEAVEKDKAK